MKISTRTEYGIRVLVTLARHGADGPLSLSGIARAEKLPHAYLEQLVGDLRRAGLVTATRGQAGGYRLSRTAEEISLAEVVRALEGPLLEMPCAGADDAEACDRPQPCSVHEVFQRVQKSLVGTLTATTLGQVAATAGGPPYPAKVRRQHRSAMSAAARATSTRAPMAVGTVMGQSRRPASGTIQRHGQPSGTTQRQGQPSGTIQRHASGFTSGDHEAPVPGAEATAFTPGANLDASTGDSGAQRTRGVNFDGMTPARGARTARSTPSTGQSQQRKQATQ
jgi:Rrf2 family protein